MNEPVKTNFLPEAFPNGTTVEVHRGTRLDTAKVLGTRLKSRSNFVEKVLVQFTYNNIRTWVDVESVCLSGSKAGYVPRIHPALMARAERQHKSINL